jgi:hypothetical protein
MAIAPEQLRKFNSRGTFWTNLKTPRSAFFNSKRFHPFEFFYCFADLGRGKIALRALFRSDL